MLMSSLALTASALATGTTKIPQPDTVSPGFAGFAAIFLLACATILLMRSMTKHLRKVRYSPDPDAPGEAGPIPPAEDRPKPS